MFVGWTSTERTGKPPTAAAAARIADSPKPPLPQGLGRAPNTQRYGRSLAGYPDRLGPGLDKKYTILTML